MMKFSSARGRGPSGLALVCLALAGSAALAAGNPDGHCTVPVSARAVPVDNPNHVIGTGTPGSCTSAAVVSAVAKGGKIVFNCGPNPVTITMTATAKVFNDKPDVVLDGGNLVTLSGNGVRRILYQNTCDEKQHWTSAECDKQDYPKLTVQNITLRNGNSTNQNYGLAEVYGGGAIFVRGGRLKIVNSRFYKNVCEPTGPDLGGGAVRVWVASKASSVYITQSTFGAYAGDNGNVCSNGGAISGLDTSFSIYNSLITHNKAVGYGANPARPGTPGGGSGGAIYQDGLTFGLLMCGTKITYNHANEGGGASFFVSNDLTGAMSITDSTLSDNPNDGFDTQGLPGIFILAKPGQPVVKNSIIE